MRQRLVETRVRFKRLSREEIESYLASGEWRGKAGGYAIQGLAGAFVVKLVGSYTNVVGLPLYETVGLLAGEGFPVHANWQSATARDHGRTADAKVTPLRPKLPCPICGKPSAREHYPFCSQALQGHRPQPLAVRRLRDPRPRRRGGGGEGSPGHEPE